MGVGTLHLGAQTKRSSTKTRMRMKMRMKTRMKTGVELGPGTGLVGSMEEQEE